MQTEKREIVLQKEKPELTATVEKREQTSQNSLCKHKIKCVNCNRIIAETDDLDMGRVVVQCGKCGVKNGIDKTSTQTRTGRYL